MNAHLHFTPMAQNASHARQNARHAQTPLIALFAMAIEYCQAITSVSANWVFSWFRILLYAQSVLTVANLAYLR